MVCERREHRDPMEYDEEMLRDENHHFNRQTTEEHLTDEHDTDLEEEMMRIDPLQLEWRRQLHVEDPIDAQNSFGNWCPAKISQIADEELHIEFLNMNPTWNRWIPIDSGRLAPYRTKAGNDSVPLRIAQEVEARRVAGSVMWKNAFIVKIRGDSVLVRYAGRQQEFDEWIPFSPDHLAPCGDHLQMRRTFVDQRRRLLINTSGKELEKKRPRIFVQGSSSFGSGSGQTNPRFLQYQNALRQNGLDLVSVEGDGNCLFRSISHQVYGDDKYHTLVRASCMDYMESEKEYFQPFVIGDMTHFIRYLNHKRQNGIWGDDPELQAMCELYDRPAEVYAYDPVHGYRKLRTFHENSTTLARNRPPIRLSYYGGGHYDSIVATDHLNNIIREPPGEWERRHLAYSRHINTRQVNSDSLTEESQLKALSDRESTEVAQLEQVLMLSRHEFDAMDSTIEDTLKLSLQEAGVSMTQYEETEQKQVEEAQRISEMASLQAELIEKARQVSEEEQLKKALQASIEHQKAFEEQEMKVEDPELAAAVAASLQEAPVGVYSFDEDEEIRRAMELSYQEYASTSIASSTTKEKQQQQEDFEDMDELQRAIQASLQEK